MLRSAATSSPDVRLTGVLEAFQRQWRAIGRKRYPNLADDLDDAIQEALVKLTDLGRLASLRDPMRIEAWARSLFVNTVLDLRRSEQVHTAGRAELGGAEAGEPESLIELLAAAVEGPEETAAYQQRLRLVAGCIESMEVARLKFIDDLPDKEIAARCNLTRDGVAGQLKRLRKRLREVLAAADRITEGAPK